MNYEDKLEEKVANMSREELEKFALENARSVQIYLEALRSLRNNKFKPSSETSDSLQLSLFNELEDTIDHSSEEELKETITYERKKKSNSKAMDISSLEVKEIHHRLKDLKCPVCKTKLKELKSEVIDKLIYKPAEYYIERHIYHNYVCNNCSKEKDSLVTYKSEDNIARLVKGSIVSSSAIANIAYEKFIMGTPLYRQEADLYRKKIYISRQTMSNWLSLVSNDYLRFVFSEMHNDLKNQEILHLDETTLTVLEDKKLEDKDKSYIWLALSNKYEEKKMALYFYNHSREYAFLNEIIGEDYKGYIQSDGYGAYQNRNFTNIACFAHVRRKFIDAYESSSLSSTYKKLQKDERQEFLDSNPSFNNVIKAISYIDQLFHLENKEMSLEERAKLRKDKSTIIFNEFISFIESLKDSYAPKSKTAIAINYTLKLKDELANYLLDPRLEIDNNAAERMIKPFVMARKNFLFSNTKSGATTSAIYFSILESAKINNLNPYKYLVYLLDELSIKGISSEVIKSLLPYSKSLPKQLYVNKKPAK